MSTSSFPSSGALSRGAFVRPSVISAQPTGALNIGKVDQVGMETSAQPETRPRRADGDREVLRCSHCRLMQFATKTRKCRRCRKAYVDPVIDVAPTVAPAKQDAGSRFDWGAAVKVLRIAKGLNQGELAMRSGINRKHISLVESAKADMNVETFTRFAAALGVSVMDFIAVAEAAGQYTGA